MGPAGTGIAIAVNRGVLWANTVVLILSSAAMQWARSAASHSRADRVRAGLIAGGVFAWRVPGRAAVGVAPTAGRLGTVDP